MSEGYSTPDFARIEMSLSDKAGLRTAAQELRRLARSLDAIATTRFLSDQEATFLAWGNIKTSSQKLRGK